MAEKSTKVKKISNNLKMIKIYNQGEEIMNNSKLICCKKPTKIQKMIVIITHNFSFSIKWMMFLVLSNDYIMSKFNNTFLLSCNGIVLRNSKSTLTLRFVFASTEDHILSAEQCFNNKNSLICEAVEIIHELLTISKTAEMSKQLRAEYQHWHPP